MTPGSSSEADVMQCECQSRRPEMLQPTTFLCYNSFFRCCYTTKPSGEPAVIKRLISVLNKSTGEVTKKKPK